MSASSPVSAARLALLARRARQDGLPALLREPIAVIGMGCRLPGGATDPERYWALLEQGFDAVTESPAERWSAESWYDPDPATPARTSVRTGGFLEDVAGFDAGFFGISRREAERMDPHQRLALEVAWEALEDAGLTVGDVWERAVGVFAASYNTDYVLHQYLRTDAINERTITGVNHSIVANRISHYFGMTGPSMTVDTACSSSLVAVHLAVASLRSGACDAALAGGVSLMLRPEPFVALSKAGFMAPDGRCKPFDARADGFGRGEGCGFIVLKRLSDALAAGDRIDAVIRGSALNQDGRSTVLAAPNGRSQVAVVRAALEDAQLDPAAVSHIEAHGTGTRLGDPIEVESLAEALGPAGPEPRTIASVKANIGHLEAAAGIAGVIKTVLCLRHGRLPPQVQFQEENPLLGLAASGFEVPLAVRQWQPRGATRVAGVSSFGVGGTNAHIVLEEPPALPALPAWPTAGGSLLVLSARTPAARDALAARWADLLEQAEDTPAAARALCAAAAQHRTAMEERLAVVGERPRDLARLLRAGEDADPAEVRSGRMRDEASPRVVFVFNGQGSQWTGMGAALLAEAPQFRMALEEVDAHFQPLAGWSLVAALEGGEMPGSLDDTGCAQPLIFGIQIGLARVLEAWGVTPAVVLGHSIGELAAAAVAGHLTLHEAVEMVFHRSVVMQQHSPEGAMLAARLSPDQAEAAARGSGVTVAAINGPGSVVFSGPAEDVGRMEAQLSAAGERVRRLNVRYGFHSAQMRPLEGMLRAVLSAPSPAVPRATLISTVTGEPIAAGAFDAAYVARNVVSPVRFKAAVDAAIRQGGEVFLELGPRPALSADITEALAAAGREGAVISALTQRHPARAGLLGALGSLFCAGVEPDWRAVLGPAVPDARLPAYPWQHERHWLDGEERGVTAVVGGDPQLGRVIDTPAIEGTLYERIVRAEDDALADHVIGGHCLMPAAQMLELARLAGERTLEHPIAVTDAEFLQPVRLDESRPVQLWVRPDGGQHRVELYARTASGWQLAFRARLDRATVRDTTVVALAALDAEMAAARKLEATQFYTLAASSGCDFGAGFQRLAEVRVGEGVAVARLIPAAATTGGGNGRTGVEARGRADTGGRADAPGEIAAGDTASGDRAYSPALLDAALQPAIALLGAAGTLHVPAGVGAYERLRPGDPVWSIVRAVPGGDRGRFDVTLLGADGGVLAQVERLTLRPAPAGFLDAADLDRSLYGIRWTTPGALPDTAGEREPAGWYVVAADASLKQGVEATLRAGGQKVLQAPSDPAGLAACVADAASSTDPVGWVVCADADTETTGAAVCAPVLAVVRSFAAGRGDRVVLLSRGAHGTEPGEAVVAPRAAALAGLARTVRREYPEVHCTAVDLDPAGDGDPVPPELARVALTGEPLVAWRRGGWRVPRLERLAAGADEDTRSLLTLGTAGDPDSVRLERAAKVAPGPGEVEIAVRWGALNFRDVLATLGMVTARPADALGHECAGTVSRVGRGVTDLSPGDAVVALSEGAFADRVVCRRERVFRRPSGLDGESAATLPIAYLTAWHALVRVAGVQAGQRVLIHSGTGGVGLAAIRLARSLGMTVFATAGTAEKRTLLLAEGAVLAADSRSTRFREEILAATDGEGVDVVVNSLSGEAVDAGLAVVASGGCFVELGKRDLRSAADVAASYPGVRYIAFDLFDEMDRDAAPYEAAWRELSQELDAGRLLPLPRTVFPAARAVDAFRLMARGGHTGKVLLSFADVGERVAIRDDATYLVTGGTGEVGLASAAWLVERGARSVVLASRRAPAGRVAERMHALRERGADVVWEGVDLGDAGSVRDLVARVTARGPLRGVVHAAAALADGLLADLSPEHVAAAFHAKVEGAFHLAHCVDADALDFLHLASAAGSTLDPAGQGAYAAANASVDALAAQLRSEGWPATSVAWGLWQGGMTESLYAAQLNRWHAQGLRPLSPAMAVAVMDRLSSVQRAFVAPLLIDWVRHFRQRPDADRLFSELQPATIEASPARQREALLAQPTHLRRRRLRQYLLERLQRVLGRDDLESEGADRPLRDLGLDSLMAVELRNLLTRELGESLPATLVFDYPDLPALTDHIAERLFAGEPAAMVGPEPNGATARTAVVAAMSPGATVAAVQGVANGATKSTSRGLSFGVAPEIEALSDEEAERELMEELRLLGEDPEVES